MSQFHIRRALEEDVEEIYRMSKELAVQLKWQEVVKGTPEVLRQSQMLYKCLVVEDRANNDSTSKPLIGFALYVYNFSAWKGRIALLDNIYVSPGHRGKGIGSALLKMVAKDVEASGCSVIELLTLGSNSRANVFYKDRGALDYTEEKDVHFYKIPVARLLEICKS